MKGPTNSSARPNIRLMNVSATFESNPDTSNNLEFPYRASIEADGVSEYMSATVMFSQIQATSGNFATYCQTDEDVIYIYSKTDVGTITIPAVSCDLSVNYINVDNVPTEDSQAVITSGGVYDNCVRTSGNQTIAGQKTFSNTPTLRDAFPQTYLDNTSDDYTTSYASVDTKYYIALRDKNQLAVSHILNYVYNGGRGLSISAFDKSSGSVKEANIGLVVPKSSTPYVTASYRTYNSANTSDVMTIGHLTPVDLTSQVTADPNQGTFNTTFSTVTRSGNVVVITIGGSNIGSGLNDSYYLYNVPKAFKNAYAGIYDVAKQKLLGYLQIRAGEKIVRATTYDSGVNYAITMELVYLTNE